MELGWRCIKYRKVYLTYALGSWYIFPCYAHIGIFKSAVNA